MTIPTNVLIAAITTFIVIFLALRVANRPTSYIVTISRCPHCDGRTHILHSRDEEAMILDAFSHLLDATPLTTEARP